MAQAGKGNEALKNQIATQAQNHAQGSNFQTMIQSEFAKIFPAIKSMVPKHMTPERLMRISLAAISRTPKLATCTPESLIGAVTACATMGLEPNLIGHAYLVPFWNGKARKMECQFQIGYKGYITLIRNTGDVSQIDAQNVYENDLFVYLFGDEHKLIHIPFAMVKYLNEGSFTNGESPIIHSILKEQLKEWNKRKPNNAGKVVGYYSLYKLKDGSFGFTPMTIEEIEKHRDTFTKSKDDKGNIVGPWKDHFDAMAKKTCIKQMVKLMPISIEIQDQLTKDEAVVKFNENTNGMNDIDLFNVDYSVISEPSQENYQGQSHDDMNLGDPNDPDFLKGTPFE